MLLKSLGREQAEEMQSTESRISEWRSEGEIVIGEKQPLGAISVNSVVIREYGGGQATTARLHVLRLAVLWLNSLWKVA